MSIIDLHMHTCYSDDGELTPLQIIEKCQFNGIKVLAFADHNSVRGIEEGIKISNAKELKFIPAAEFDCYFRGINLHVLGYNLKKEFDAFNNYENYIFQQELTLSKKRIDAIKSIGIEVDDKKVYALSDNGIITAEMIAEVAMSNERNADKLQSYLSGGSRSDNPFVNFYWDYFANGSFSYLKPRYLDLTNVIKMIKNAGGIPVLAHPGQNISDNINVLYSILDCGIEGIEAFSSYHTKQQSMLYEKFARDNGLIITIGSDYHGKTKPGIKLGQTMATEQVEKEVYDFFSNL